MTDMTLPDKLADIRRGLEGVTPGPWKMATDLPAIAIMALNADGKGGYRVVQTPNQNNYRHFGPANNWDGIQHQPDAAHIARLDPDTIREWLDYTDALQSKLDLIREEAGKSNAPLGRSDSLALDRIRTVLGEAT